MNSERRSLHRMLRNESVSLQLTLPSSGAGAGRVIRIETLDISPTGLRITLPERVEEERLLDLCIDLKDHNKRFLLTGEVRWCRPSEGAADRCEAGIEVLEGEGTDHAAWFRFLRTEGGDIAPQERSLRALDEPCTRLRALCEGYTTWEWDTWFRAALCVLESDEMDAVLHHFEGLLPYHWDQGHTNDATHLVFPVSARIGGLDHAQRLLTTAPDAPVVLFAALWPWGNGHHVSIRVGLFSPGDSPDTELALEARLRACFLI